MSDGINSDNDTKNLNDGYWRIVTIPQSLDAEARELSAQRGCSFDHLVTEALSQYIQSDRRRISEI